MSLQIEVKKNLRHFNIVKFILTTQNLNVVQNRKNAKFKINNVEVKLQLVIGSYITIINEKTR